MTGRLESCCLSRSVAILPSKSMINFDSFTSLTNPFSLTDPRRGISSSLPIILTTLRGPKDPNLVVRRMNE